MSLMISTVSSQHLLHLGHGPDTEVAQRTSYPGLQWTHKNTVISLVFTAVSLGSGFCGCSGYCWCCFEGTSVCFFMGMCSVCVCVCMCMCVHACARVYVSLTFCLVFLLHLFSSSIFVEGCVWEGGMGGSWGGGAHLCVCVCMFFLSFLFRDGHGGMGAETSLPVLFALLCN